MRSLQVNELSDTLDSFRSAFQGNQSVNQRLNPIQLMPGCQRCPARTDGPVDRMANAAFMQQFSSTLAERALLWRGLLTVPGDRPKVSKPIVDTLTTSRAMAGDLRSEGVSGQETPTQRSRNCSCATLIHPMRVSPLLECPIRFALEPGRTGRCFILQRTAQKCGAVGEAEPLTFGHGVEL